MCLPLFSVIYLAVLLINLLKFSCCSTCWEISQFFQRLHGAVILISTPCLCLQRPQLVKGNMQLYSVEQNRSQALEAHAASFATFKV